MSRRRFWIPTIIELAGISIMSFGIEPVAVYSMRSSGHGWKKSRVPSTLLTSRHPLMYLVDYTECDGDLMPQLIKIVKDVICRALITLCHKLRHPCVQGVQLTLYYR